MVFGRRYRVTERIGSGGMAEVYKAVDEVLGRTVAVKVLHPRYAAEENFVARFRQEAQSAANLSHPNIVNIYDWGREGDTHYIVMEYVRGIDLKSLVVERGAQDPMKVAEWGVQVCSALAVAHGYDIIHRDIKPHNIVLTPDGTIKVMDFGIARAGNTTMTQTGSVLGTAHYVSPEQAQGRPLGPASDLYSLGVVLYELTTGRLPFDADTPVAVALKQVNEEPVPPRAIEPAIPPALEAVILRSMRKDPAERHASAEEMRADLKRVIAGEAVAPVTAVMTDRTSVLPQVGPPAAVVGERVRPVASRRRVWPWVVAALALLALALGGAYGLGLFEGRVPVPRVIGMTEDEAVATLREAGLTTGDVETDFDDEAEPGTVLGQDPGPDELVERGRAVDLVVSRGREQVEVPDLTGAAEADAEAELQRLGFRVRTQREHSSSVDADHVIRTVPEGGVTTNKGDTVTLVVSRGVETKRVPDVTGRSSADARRALEAEGFRVRVQGEYHDTVRQGQVISQTPSANSLVDAGATVTITVSRGKQLVKVPEVRQKTEAKATDELRKAGLSVQVTYVPNDADDVVISQDPLPGREVEPGTTVRITVGRTAPESPDPEGP